MVITASLPYFCPYPGFFYKAGLAEVTVILDAVQFSRRTTWLSRNRFKNDQGTLWLTIPVWKKGLGLQRIDQVRIAYEGRWAKKHLESLKVAYAHAPYFEEHLPLVEEMFSGRFERLLDLNLAVIRYLMDHLGIKTELVLLSRLEVEGKGTRLLVNLCRALSASAFLAPGPARKHLEVELFAREGIELYWSKYQVPTYPQLWADFLANLSALDLVFNCGPKAAEILVKGQPDYSRSAPHEPAALLKS